MPYCNISRDTRSGALRMHFSMEGELLQVLEQKCNFRANLVDGHQTWGMRLPNGSWTGVIGQVYSEVSSKILKLFLILIFFTILKGVRICNLRSDPNFGPLTRGGFLDLHSCQRRDLYGAESLSRTANLLDHYKALLRWNLVPHSVFVYCLNFADEISRLWGSAI